MELETARRVLSNFSQMLQPFNLALAMGLAVDTAKTTGIGYILFQFDPRYPPACELLGFVESMAGPMNFLLQGVWSVGAKGLWADLSLLESEVVGYWHAFRRLHYHIRGAPTIRREGNVRIVSPHVQAPPRTHGVSIPDSIHAEEGLSDRKCGHVEQSST